MDLHHGTWISIFLFFSCQHENYRCFSELGFLILAEKKCCCYVIIIIITIYFKNVHFFHAQLGSDVFPDMRLLHIFLNIVHSECKPSSSVSSFTHSLQVFLLLPTHLTPATTTFLQADTQSSPLSRSTCPNHLNLPRLTTSTTLSTPKRL